MSSHSAADRDFFVEKMGAKICPQGISDVTKTIAVGASEYHATECTLGVTCLANQVKTVGVTAATQTEPKTVYTTCTNCNGGAEAPAMCAVDCYKDDCANTCKYSSSTTANSANGACSSCSDNAYGTDRMRSWSTSQPCRAACNECKKDSKCVFVAGWNQSNAAKRYKNPDSDDSTCADA